MQLDNQFVRDSFIQQLQVVQGWVLDQLNNLLVHKCKATEERTEYIAINQICTTDLKLQLGAQLPAVITDGLHNLPTQIKLKLSSTIESTLAHCIRSGTKLTSDQIREI